MRVLALAICSFFCINLSNAQQIIAYDGSSITFSNGIPSGVLSIEWNDSLTGSWKADWSSLRGIIVTSLVNQLPVPMYFRGVFSNPSLEWSIVGDITNQNDSLGFGAVSYKFSISKYEISNQQYADFLNTVDPAGTNKYGLFRTESNNDKRAGIRFIGTNQPGFRYTIKQAMSNKPVVYVSFWSALRFCNWLHNGTNTAATETGAYNLLGDITPTNNRISRSPYAKFFLPNENEWFKAAYFDPTKTNKYWTYPTSSDIIPDKANATDTDPPGSLINENFTNVVNYGLGASWNGLTGNVTIVGAAGTNSTSPYGVMDMGGNVSEWVESSFSDTERTVRGGSWLSQESTLQKSARNGYTPITTLNSLGFRIAAPVSEF